jgi:hypothetical protein
MHLHPTVGRMMIEIGREFRLRRIRVPAEPPWVLRRCGERVKPRDWALFLWTRLLRWQARGLAGPDQVFGIKWSGHITLARVRRLLAQMPPGESEIYFHPATARDKILTALMPEYEHVAELEALLLIKEGSRGCRPPPA